MERATTEEMVTIVVKAGSSASSGSNERSSSTSASASNGAQAANEGSVELPRAWLTTPITEVLHIPVYPSTSSDAQSAVEGLYREQALHFNRKFYSRVPDPSQPSGLEMYLYYWEDTWAPRYSGWYVSTAVSFFGRTYAFNASHGFTVPRTGWQLSVNGPVEDTFILEKAPEEVQKREINSFFEAKLERWQDKDATPMVVLEIPDECNAAEGARLLRERFQAKVEGVAGKPELWDPVCRINRIGWFPLTWWKATKGDLASLSAALHIFHLTLLEDWAREVALTLHRFGLCCSESMMAIGAELKVKSLYSLPTAQPIQVTVSFLKMILKDACNTILNHSGHAPSEVSISKCGKCRAAKVLADRAILGSSPSKDVIKVLVGQFFSCFHLNALSDAFGRKKPHSPIDWLSDHLEGMVRRRSDAFVDICSSVQNELPLSGDMSPDLADLFETADLDREFVAAVCRTLCRSLTILLVKSALTPDRSDEVSSVIRRSIPRTFLLTFRDPEKFPEDSEVVGVFPGALAVANPSVQSTFLQSLPQKGFVALKGCAHLVHEDARHLLLAKSSVLSAEDVVFLSSASFPGLPSCPIHVKQEDLDEEDERPAKRSRS